MTSLTYTYTRPWDGYELRLFVDSLSGRKYNADPFLKMIQTKDGNWIPFRIVLGDAQNRAVWNELMTIAASYVGGAFEFDNPGRF